MGEGLSQPSWRDRYMHHMVPSENSSQRRRGQGIEHRKGPRCAGQKPCPFGFAAITRLYRQTRLTRLYPFARFFKTRNGLSRAPGEAQGLGEPLDQCRLEQLGKIGWHYNRTTGGPGEGTRQLPVSITADVAWFYHIPARAQPYSPAGQARPQIGDQGAVWRHDEADHLLLRQPLTAQDTAAQRARFRLVIIAGAAVKAGLGFQISYRGLSPPPPQPVRPPELHRPRHRTNGRAPP